MADAKPKKNFFKKPQWLEEKNKNEVKAEARPDVKKDATQMFARSTGTVSDVIAEQKRKEQLRAERRAAKAAQKEAEESSRKRRKTSEDGEYEADRDEKKCALKDTALHMILMPRRDSISPRRTTRQSSQSSPKSLLNRHEAFLEKLKREKDAIVLSDASDDDTTATYKPSKSNSSPSKKTPVEKEDSQKDEEDEDEEFRALAAKAREKARKEEQERKQASRSRSRGDGFDAPSESQRPVDTGPNPTISILVYSNIEDTEPLLVKRKWNQPFKEIRQAWVSRQRNLTEQERKDVYFTWRCKKVFDIATCKNLGIKLDQYGNAIIPNDQGDMRTADDQIALCATTDAQQKKEKEAKEAERIRKEKEEEELEEEPQTDKETSKKLRLFLKAQGYKDTKLSVSPVSSFWSASVTSTKY